MKFFIHSKEKYAEVNLLRNRIYPSMNARLQKTRVLGQTVCQNVLCIS